MDLRKQATINMASGGSHPVTMPTRQASVGSAMSDEAVPTADPKDVSAFNRSTVEIRDPES